MVKCFEFFPRSWCLQIACALAAFGSMAQPNGEAISEMAPIRDIHREPVSWFDYWPWGLLALAIIGCLAWFVRHYLRRPPIVKVPVEILSAPVTASETALHKLNNLEQQRLWDTGQVKAHYAELSMIIREYLESKYHVAALESTTVEILALLTTSDFPANQVTLLRDLLQKTDMVKYAQSEPPAATHEILLEKGRELVSGNSHQQQVYQSMPNKENSVPKT